MEKICSRCKEPKLLSEFNKDSSRPDGYAHRCRICQKTYHKEWRDSSDVFQEYQERYYKENRERINSRKRNYYHENKDWLLPLMNARRFFKKYGITQEEAQVLLDEQGGCGICRTDDPGPLGWCVDHDHETGEVRGVLCGKCNSGLGFLGDTKAALESALAYLS